MSIYSFSDALGPINPSVLSSTIASPISGVTCQSCNYKADPPVLSLCNHYSCVECYKRYIMPSHVCNICNANLPICQDESFGLGLSALKSANASHEIKDIFVHSERAIEYFNKVLQWEPRIPYIRAYLGQCYIITGNFKLAIEHLNDALSEKQDDQPAFIRYLLACVYKNSECLEDALNHANAAVISANESGFPLGSDITLSDCENLIEELRPMVDSKLVNALRFQLGTRVECRTSSGWREGRIIKQHYREERFDPNFTAPYQILLVDNCTCPGECKCGDRYIYAPSDKDYCIRSIRRRPSRHFPQLKGFFPFEEISKTTLASILPKIIAPYDWLLMKLNLEFYIDICCSWFLARVRVFWNREENSYVSGICDFFCKPPTRELIQRIRDNNDSAAMIDLADVYFYYMRQNEVKRDLPFIRELYLKAADDEHPAAYMALAVMHFHRLFPDINEIDIDYTSDIHRNQYNTFDFNEMWKYLELCATVDYVTPFMLYRIYEAKKNGIDVLSQTMKSILDYREDELDKEYLAKLKSLPSQHVVFYCANGPCSVVTTDASTFKLCGRCMNPAIKYCSKECQKQNWGFHKRFCSEITPVESINANKMSPNSPRQASSHTISSFSSPKASTTTFTASKTSPPSHIKQPVSPQSQISRNLSSTSTPSSSIITPPSSSSSSSSSRNRGRNHITTSTSAQLQTTDISNEIVESISEMKISVSRTSVDIMSLLSDSSASQVASASVYSSQMIIDTSKYLKNLMSYQRLRLIENKFKPRFPFSERQNDLIRRARREQLIISGHSIKSYFDLAYYASFLQSHLKHTNALRAITYAIDELYFTSTAFSAKLNHNAYYAALIIHRIELYSKLVDKTRSKLFLKLVEDDYSYLVYSGVFKPEDYEILAKDLNAIKAGIDAQRLSVDSETEVNILEPIDVLSNGVAVVPCSQLITSGICYAKNADCAECYCPICCVKWEVSSSSCCLHAVILPCKHALCLFCLWHYHAECERASTDNTYSVDTDDRPDNIETILCCPICQMSIPPTIINDSIDYLVEHFSDGIFMRLVNILFLSKEEGKLIVKHLIRRYRFDIVFTEIILFNLIGILRRKTLGDEPFVLLNATTNEKSKTESDNMPAYDSLSLNDMKTRVYGLQEELNKLQEKLGKCNTVETFSDEYDIERMIVIASEKIHSEIVESHQILWRKLNYMSNPRYLSDGMMHVDLFQCTMNESRVIMNDIVYVMLPILRSVIIIFDNELNPNAATSKASESASKCKVNFKATNMLRVKASVKDMLSSNDKLKVEDIEGPHEALRVDYID